MILVKQYPSAELAHLYKILYCKSIDAFLQTHGVYRYLDYSLAGITHYKGGLILIEIIFYSEKATKYTDEIKYLAIDIDETSIGLGIAQIAAKTKTLLGSSGLKEITHALEMLHHQPWQDIDELDAINTRSIKMKASPLWTTQGEPQRTRDLIVDIALHPIIATSRPELLPLFTRLADFIHLNCEGVVANAFGLYSNGVAKVRHTDDFGMPLVFSVPPSGKGYMNDRERLKKVLWLFINWGRELQKAPVLDSFINVIHDGTYSETPYLMVNPNATLNSTGWFVGTKGWRKQATRENVNLLLDNMSIEVKYGRQTVNHPIKSNI